LAAAAKMVLGKEAFLGGATRLNAKETEDMTMRKF
jgi:hypothetical protein